MKQNSNPHQILIDAMNAGKDIEVRIKYSGGIWGNWSFIKKDSLYAKALKEGKDLSEIFANIISRQGEFRIKPDIYRHQFTFTCRGNRAMVDDVSTAIEKVIGGMKNPDFTGLQVQSKLI